MAYQLARLETHIADLPSLALDTRISAEERVVEAALARVRTIELDQLMRTDRRGRRTRLFVLLRSVERDLQELSSVLTRVYLAHTLPTRQAMML